MTTIRPWGIALGAAALGSALILSKTAGASNVPSSPNDKSQPQPTLQLGAKGPAVELWQGVVQVPVTGVFDAATLTATKSYQAAHGLDADGVVGPKTWATAGFTAAKPAQGSSKPTKPGATPIPPHQGADPLPDAPHVDSTDSGRTWALSLPKSAQLAETQAAILAAVKAGFFTEPEMKPIVYVKDGHQVVIFGWADCLAIGHVDAIRVNVWHSTAQRIADLRGLMLPTSRMSDAAWLSSVRVGPQVGKADAAMADVSRMIEHSDKVQKARNAAGASASVLSRCVGKDWVNTERLIGAPPPSHSSIGGGGGATPAGANFGWHSPAAGLKSPGGLSVFQSVGLAHEMNYTDYSQTCTLYSGSCSVDGETHTVADCLADPAMAYLLSDEVQKGTAAHIWRHPAIPFGG